MHDKSERSSTTVLPISFGTSFGLTPLQEGMLYHHLSHGGAGVDVQQLICTLREKLDIPLWERAWQIVTDRHQVLRTRFRLDDVTRPQQEFCESIPISIEHHDCSELSQAEFDERLAQFYATDRRRGFELTQPPLFRLTSFQRAVDSFVIVWTFHHLILDGRSLPIILKDVFSVYEALLDGSSLNFSAAPPYSNFLSWLQGRDLSSAETYWRTLLKGVSSCTRLAVDQLTHGEADSASHGFGRFSRDEIHLSEQQTTDLIELAQRLGVTMNTLLQGAWGLLLSRYSGEDDVVFGATRACRYSHLPEALQIAGMFINSLPVRVELQATMPVCQYLNSLRRQQVAAREFEHTPLTKVREWSGLPGNIPLFESLVVFENYQLQTVLQSLGGKWLDRQFHSRQRSGYPLTVGGRMGQRLMLCINYDQNRFDGPVVARMIEHLRTLLLGMVTHSEGQLQDIPMLTSIERQQLLVEWNDSSRDYPRELPVQALFEQQAERTPDAVALVSRGCQINYRQLNERANVLANTLQRLGIEPEQPVGLWGERSVDSIIALIGILKAGAAYVPLPLDAPPERIKTIIANAGLQHLVSGERPDWLSDCQDLKWVCAVQVPDSHRSGCEQSYRPAGDAIACIIYTSGTTGTPKGACVTHRGLVNLLTHRTQTQFQQGDFAVAPLTAPLHFDGSIVQLFSPLMTGGTLVIERTMSELVDSPWYDRLTALTGASSLVAQLVTDAGIPNCARVIGVGAEPVPPELLDRIIQSSSVERLVTGYGLTECSCYSTNTVIWERASRQSKGSSDGDVTLNLIGHPIANTQMYVLDQHEQLAPIGVPGALYVGGDGVGRGYWNRPDLTAERFVFRPVLTGQRLFLTGDRARWTADGQLEFLGRFDDQIKMRGFRIEPAEIEAILLQHEQVQKAIVLLKDDPAGEKHLVAYVVLRAQTNLDLAAQLRSELKLKLPEYMVPSAIVAIDVIPLTVNGKVDRKSLPVPDFQRLCAQRSQLAPRNPVERSIYQIWQNVLGIEQFGIDDNFFELGGHSLRATQVVSKLRDQFGCNVPVRSLFDMPTIAKLANFVEKQLTQTQLNQVPVISKVTRDDLLPLSFAQERLWFYDQFEPFSSIYNIPRVIKINGPLDTSALERSLREIVQRHESLRTNFVNFEGLPQLRLNEATAFKLSMTNLLNGAETKQQTEPCSYPITTALRGEQRSDGASLHRSSTNTDLDLESMIQREIGRAFDLSCDIMLRAHLWSLNGSEHILALTMHHIAADGWSMSVFDRELTTLYSAELSSQPAALNELPIQYVDYAAWQRQFLQGDELDRQLEFWKRQLAGASPVLELPTDFPRPALQSYRGSSQPIMLSSELSQKLESLSHREGVTPFMTLLAAFQVLLARYSGQDDVSVGAPVAGRNPTLVESLIGFFVNTLVLRTDLTDNPSFVELLARVRETTLGAYAHQELPFEKLVQELRPARSLSHSPLFQVMFVLQNVPDVSLELPDLCVSRLPVQTRTTKFDLTLNLHRSHQGFQGSLDFNSDLFEPATIERMSQHFCRLLESLIANPNLCVKAAPLLSTAEQRQIVVEWNQTTTDYPRDRCIHELFDDQVLQRPDAVALICGQDRISYRELNQRANRLADKLKQHGVGPDVLVEIPAERSIEMIVGMLGILKAGGAYVPLDPSYPAERLSLLRRDSQVHGVLQIDDLDFAPAEGLLGTPVLADPCVPIGAERTPDSADQLAYVMYTSGSTGEPKGVCVTHRGVTRLVKNSSYIQPTSDDRFLQYASPSFDAATFEIWGCLLNGGQLILPPPGTLTLDELGELLYQHQITVLWLTAGLFHVMVDRHLDDLKGLRCLLAGGDVLSTAHVRRTLDAFPKLTLINGYGPTENTTFTTCHVMKQSERFDSSVPIGRPISNTQVYILDSLMQPVPIGVTGELFTGGEGLARGYHRRPDQTALSFVPNPFGPAGSRLYKTGDSARYRPDGTIEFQGRRDHQVKIRGHRIELEEVETALGRHPAVRQCAVIAQAEQDGNRRLIAYVVLSNTAVATDELKHDLDHALPGYMVPSLIVALTNLPLSANGKVDRNALPRPEVRISVNSMLAPRDALELQLTKIWEDVLKISPISVDDNFFELGGHSLLAVKLFDRVTEAFGQSLPLTTLFECPTIKHLAKGLRHHNWQPAWKSLIAIQTGGSKPPLFIVPPAAGTVLRFAELAKHLGPDQPVYGLEPLGHNDQQSPLECVEEMASLYIQEIRDLQPTGPYLLAGICFGAYVAWEIARQLREQGCAVALVALLDPNPPAHGPTWVRKPQMPYLQRLLRDCHEHGLMQVAMKSAHRRLHPARYLKSARRRWDRLWSLFHSAGRRQTRMLDAHVRAQKSYVAHPYDGRVVLIQSETSSRKPIFLERWGKIATGPFEQVVVTGTTHEDLLLSGQFTMTLAHLLRRRVDSAIEAQDGIEHTAERTAA